MWEVKEGDYGRWLVHLKGITYAKEEHVCSRKQIA